MKAAHREELLCLGFRYGEDRRGLRNRKMSGCVAAFFAKETRLFLLKTDDRDLAPHHIHFRSLFDLHRSSNLSLCNESLPPWLVKSRKLRGKFW
jgi:hypothetical protein